MNRDDAVKALGAQPFDHEVVVNVAGTYVDVVRIRHDERRQAVVLDLQPDDVQDILDGFGLSASN